MKVHFLDTAFMDEIWTFAMKMINFGVAIFLGCYAFVTSLNYSAERQVKLSRRTSSLSDTFRSTKFGYVTSKLFLAKI